MPGQIVLIIGGAGSGKTSTSRAVAQLRPRSFHLETDRIREDMIVNTMHLPDTSLPGDAMYTHELVEQLQLVRRSVTFMARDWADSGYTVVVDDFFIPPKTVAVDYAELFADPRVTRVFLRPSGDVQVARMKARGGPFDELLSSFGPEFWQEHTNAVPLDGWNVIDNGELSVEQTRDAILSLMSTD